MFSFKGGSSKLLNEYTTFLISYKNIKKYQQQVQRPTESLSIMSDNVFQADCG